MKGAHVAMMDFDKILGVFREDTNRAFLRLMGDRGTVFWVPWSLRDERIAALCEATIRSGRLSARQDDAMVEIVFGDRSARAELADEPGDRHRTLLALNLALAPDFEARFLWDSTGSDSGAFLTLTPDQWREIEALAGASFAHRVLSITPELNIFTQLTPRMRPPAPQRATPKDSAGPDPSQRRPWWRFWG